MGRQAYDPDTGKVADIDILLMKGKSRCIAYECKSKQPGGRVTVAEVDDWLRRLPTFRKYIRNGRSLSEAEISFPLTGATVGDAAVRSTSYLIQPTSAATSSTVSRPIVRRSSSGRFKGASIPV
jgi:hypothetical protein